MQNSKTEELNSRQDTASSSVGGINVPEGYVLVPVVPTREMRRAFHKANEEMDEGDAYPHGSPDYQWKAMLAVAPPAPTSGDRSGEQRVERVIEPVSTGSEKTVRQIVDELCAVVDAGTRAARRQRMSFSLNPIAIEGMVRSAVSRAASDAGRMGGGEIQSTALEIGGSPEAVRDEAFEEAARIAESYFKPTDGQAWDSARPPIPWAIAADIRSRTMAQTLLRRLMPNGERTVPDSSRESASPTVTDGETA